MLRQVASPSRRRRRKADCMGWLTAPAADRQTTRRGRTRRLTVTCPDGGSVTQPDHHGRNGTAASPLAAGFTAST
jgi:hypothetical protein